MESGDPGAGFVYSLEDSVASATIVAVPFSRYLQYESYEVRVKAGTADEVTCYQGGLVHGPGSHVSAIAAFAFDQELAPHPIFKTGDTRLSRFERGEPYATIGGIAGRLDKEGASSSKIVLAELAEEVGGEVVEGTFLPLGLELSPTMPFESSEADSYSMAAVNITGKPYGDGGHMEVVDLIGPVLMSAHEAFAAMDGGAVSEGGRSRTMFGRGFDALGYLPSLGVYVHDHPGLRAHFSTLGLGEALDPRSMIRGGPLPATVVKSGSLESRVNSVVVRSREETPMDGDSSMVDARISHAVDEDGVVAALDAAFTSQFLHLAYDRAKVVTFYTDAERGPLVEMVVQVRPALAFAPGSPRVVRRDVSDFRIARDVGPVEQLAFRLSGGLRELGAKAAASSGQSDLYYHFLGSEVVKPVGRAADDFVPLADAIRFCREGHGDAQTEALLGRLADSLGWLPNLGMTVEHARELLS